MKTRKISFILFIISKLIFAQNLLDTSTWTIGNGSVVGFLMNGQATENNREWGENHVGESVVLWKASPDSNSDQDGGWDSDYVTIDNTKTYRFSVWIKKSNSTDGTTYFGCQQWQPDQSMYPFSILDLNNSLNTNPYFWLGDLPQLNRWYLLIGFIHENSYSSTTSLGKIYDGVTGETVANITDLKFANTTTSLRHRAYLYYDTNTSDRQYFYAPRMEKVDGFEPTINELLSINENSQLLFAYDNAGNQKQRFYCPETGCSVTPPPNGRINNEKEEFVTIESPQTYDNQLKIFPNPTKNIAYIQIEPELLSKLEFVKVYNTNSSLIQEIQHKGSNAQKLKVDLSEKPTGVYFIHIHFIDGSYSITKKIIKN